MALLEWNTNTSGRYISGVSHGVFYGDDGVPIPWNGLISVSEKYQTNEPTPVYNSLGEKYDLHGNVAEKRHSIVCYTYPEEMDDYLGTEYVEEFGFTVDEKPPRKFNMAYRSNCDGYYEVHVLLGQIATFGDKTHATDTSVPGISNITMNLQGVPHEVYGTSHLIFDSRNPITASAERILFGTRDQDGCFNNFLNAEVQWIPQAINYAPTIEPDYDNPVLVNSFYYPGIKNASKWNSTNVVPYWDEVTEQLVLRSEAPEEGTQSKLSIPLDVPTPIDLKTSADINFGGMVDEEVGDVDAALQRRIIGTREPQVLSEQAPNIIGSQTVTLNSTVNNSPHVDIYHNGPAGSDDVRVDNLMVVLQNYRGGFFDGNTVPKTRGERYRRVESEFGYYTVYEHLQFRTQSEIELRLIGTDLYELTGPETNLSIDGDQFTFIGPQATSLDDYTFEIDDTILGF